MINYINDITFSGWVHPNFDLAFSHAVHTIPTEGWLAWEYNPFFNLRLSEDTYLIGERNYGISELRSSWRTWRYDAGDGTSPDIRQASELIDDLRLNTLVGEVIDHDNGDVEYIDSNGVSYMNENICGHLYKFAYFIDPYSEILKQKGTLGDFDTNRMSFSLNNPVQIECQYSYDGSVNVILNDNFNQPMLINSRFTALEGNRYKVIDRYGNNDTNIYDDEFLSQETSLFNSYKGFPTLEIDRIQDGGDMPCGSYVFYFRFCNADGDYTDIVAQSGNVHLVIGKNGKPSTQKSGYRDENTHKMIVMSVWNDDNNYDYVEIFYTRTTGDENGAKLRVSYKIDKRYPLTTNSIIVSGNEPIVQISKKELNDRMMKFKRARTQCQSSGRLFSANLTMTDVPYDILTRLALEITPSPVYTDAVDEIGLLDEEYQPNGEKAQYYSFENVIEKVGYFPDEFYRFGVVFVMHDGTYTCAFPTRGAISIPVSADDWEHASQGATYNYDCHDMFDENIDYNEDDFMLKNKSLKYENAKGVCQFARPVDDMGIPVLNVRFRVSASLMGEIHKYAKGFFFVRQKRIPLLLCQGIGIGVEKESGCPCIKSGDDYILESFTDSDGILSEGFHDRIVNTKTVSTIKGRGLLVPELLFLNNELHDAINANEMILKESWISASDSDGFVERGSDGHYAVSQYRMNVRRSGKTTKTRLFCVNQYEKFYYTNDGYKFSYEQGVGESAIQFGSIGTKVELDKYEGDTQVLRGVSVPFVGTENEIMPGVLYDIYIPNYSETNYKMYYLDRVYDKSEFYPIYEIIDIDRTGLGKDCEYNVYNGDCYVSQVTVRMMRNFNDPSNPINDKIINQRTWLEYWHNLNHKDETTGVSVLKNVGKAIGDTLTGGLISAMTTEDVDNAMNTGDINAVSIGHWATFTVYSTANIIRTDDYSYVEETSMYGNPRSFFPFSSMTRDGRGKRTESFVMNPGLRSGLSDVFYMEKPDIPYIKNVFNTRIAYSKLHATDGFSNKYRYFMPGNYRDYPINYGGITKIIPWGGGLYVVFEHGIAYAPINETVSIGDRIVRTGDVLPEKLQMISETYGSQWTDSVIITGDGSESDPGCLYGVDTVNKCIWTVSGKSFKVITRMCLEPFMNDNITLTERELTPIVGIRNVKTHYVRYKKDVLFTFYDNLTGFEENVWNLCYNEEFGKFITFYSWVPSYSENIDLMYFSFDRNVSKKVAKLWTTVDNDYIFADTSLFDSSLDHPSVVIRPSVKHLSENLVTEFTDSGMEYPSKLTGTDAEKEEKCRKASENGKMYCDCTISLDRDNMGNYLQFVDPVSDVSIEDQLMLNDGVLTWMGYWDDDAKDWRRDTEGNYVSVKPDRNKVYLLNVKSEASYVYYKKDVSLRDYARNLGRYMKINAGYYEQVLAFASEDCVNGYPTEVVDPDGNRTLEWTYPLATDFWKHGNAGIIDISEKLKPAYWYEKQHPLEIEVLTAIGTDVSFSGMTIVSNETQPESFHYTINAQPYEFKDDLHNMYFRQEAIKYLYKCNYHDIINKSFIDVPVSQRMLPYRPNYPVADKSVLFPLFYSSVDTYDEIEDSYQRITGDSRNYQCLSGTEITYDHVTDTYGMQVHVKANPIGEWYDQDLTEETARTRMYIDKAMVRYNIDGRDVDTSIAEYDASGATGGRFHVWLRASRLRGNCWFKDGIWYVQDPSIVLYRLNEPRWDSIKGNGDSVLRHPILNIALNPVADEPRPEIGKLYIPKDLLNLHYMNDNGSVICDDSWMRNRGEVRIKGSYIKTRIRYKGDKLALIGSVITSFN